MKVLVFALIALAFIAGCRDDGSDAYAKGMACYTGSGCVKDVELAAAWFEKAAQKGNVDAKMKLGEFREKGIGLGKDASAAAGWYFEALKAGKIESAYALADILAANSNIVCDVSVVSNALEKLGLGNDGGDAYFQLARLHNLGRFGETDDTGLKYMLKAAEEGHVEGMYAYGVVAIIDEDKKIRDEGRDYLVKAAEEENVRAQVWLALCYSEGYGLERDDKEALKWQIRAAKNGDGEMLAKLGVRYWNGDGVVEDKIEALRFFRKAIAKKEPVAAAIMGELYRRGDEALGIEKDEVKSFELYKICADAGHIPGTFCLGYAYYHGLGVEPNKKKAVEYYRIAAEAGHSDAQRMLALAFKSGDGVEKDVDKARFWLRKSAGAGNSLAMLALGWMYYDSENSRWVDKDAARKWFKKAVDAGEERAKESLKLVE